MTPPRATAGTGVHAYLTGPDAGDADIDNFMGRRLPWVIAMVVLSMLLILAMLGGRRQGPVERRPAPDRIRTDNRAAPDGASGGPGQLTRGGTRS